MNYIFSDNMYIYCIYRVIWKVPKQLSNGLKREETSVVLIVFDYVLCEVRSCKPISINAVTVSYRLSTWIRYQKTHQNFTLFGFEIFLTLSVPDEGNSRNSSYALNSISRFLLIRFHRVIYVHDHNYQLSVLAWLP